MAVEKCRDFWQDLNFTSFQKELDEFTSEIAKRQDEADQGKKRLIEMSKEFKKTASDESRKAASSLLKAFQMEVDKLTRRSKGAESHFLNVYKKLADAPDPYPVLLQASSNQLKLSNLTDLEIENKQLRETLTQYNIQFAEFRAQKNELLNLKSKHEELMSSMERVVAQRVSELNESVSKDYDFKTKLLLEQNSELQRTSDDQAVTISKLQASLEKTETELFEIKTRFEEEVQNKNAEIEQYLFEIEVVNQKLSQMSDSASVLHSTGMDTAREEEFKMKIKVLDSELLSKDSEIMRLIEETHSLQAELHNRDICSKEAVSRLQHDHQLLLEKHEECTKRISQQSDYDDIKKELTILKTVEFGSHFEESSEKSLEMLLLDKNRSLQSDNSNLRLEVHNCHKKVSMLEAEASNSKITIENQMAEVAQLENELSCLQSHRIREEADGEASIPDMESVTDNKVDMLAIVTSQRERLKARNDILETDFQQLKSSYAVLQQDNTTLRDDNMKLYERIKFLQTVSSPTTNTYTDDSLTSKYSTQYEAHIDPFNAFNRNERKRKYANLNSAERVVLNLSRMILGDKRARVGVFFYTLFMHMLIFLVLYKFAVSEDCVQLSDCQEKFEAHMQNFHKNEH